MVKIKKLINESAWDRKFGEALPTLSSVMEKHGGCECEGHGDCGCAVTEDVKDVANTKKVLQKLMKAEGKLRKHMMKIADTMEGHTVNIQLSKQLRKSYKANVTSFMREVIGMITRMK